MTIQTTQLANLSEGARFRTSRNGAFYYVDGFDRITRRMQISGVNGDICQMRPRRKVFWKDDASY
jgi:hypothetical protein